MRQKFRAVRAALLPSLLLGWGVLCATAPAHAQGFDCRYAATPDEKLICRDSRLGRLDEELNSVYARQYYGTSSPARTRLDQQEDSWVIERRRCGTDYACVEQSYRRRIEQLGGAGRAAQGATPQPQQGGGQPQQGAVVVHPQQGAAAHPQQGAVAQPQQGSTPQQHQSPIGRPEQGTTTQPQPVPAARLEPGAIARPEQGPIAQPSYGAAALPEPRPAARPDHGPVTRPEEGTATRPEQGAT